MISSNFKKRFLTATALFILIFSIFFSKKVMIFTLLIFAILAIIEFFDISKKIFKKKLYTFVSNLLFILFISLYSFLFYSISNLLYLKIILFILLLGCVSSDIGGFIFGKFFKGPKLSKFSPNKTIAGSIGSFLFTSIVTSYLILYFTQNFNYKILFISLVVSLTCQVGDLFFSYLKRLAKIKDTGKILPGHGGILDRVDGILFGLPFGFITFIFVY